jgi:hypothetical protein
LSRKTKKVKLTNLVNKLNWTEDRKIVNTRSVWALKKGRGTKLEKKIGQKTRKWENEKGKSGKKDFESFESFSPSYRICKLSPFKCIPSAKPLRRLHLKCVDRKVKFGQQKINLVILSKNFYHPKFSLYVQFSWSHLHMTCSIKKKVTVCTKQ